MRGRKEGEGGIEKRKQSKRVEEGKERWVRGDGE